MYLFWYVEVLGTASGALLRCTRGPLGLGEPSRHALGEAAVTALAAAGTRVLVGLSSGAVRAARAF